MIDAGTVSLKSGGCNVAISRMSAGFLSDRGARVAPGEKLRKPYRSLQRGVLLSTIFVNLILFISFLSYE